MYQDLIRLIEEIAEYLARYYDEIREGVKEVMGGRILPLPGDAIREALARGRAEGRAEGREEGREEGRAEGRAKGREEGRAEGREEGREEMRGTIRAMIRTMYESGYSITRIVGMTGRSLENVTEDLRAQGISPA